MGANSRANSSHLQTEQKRTKHKPLFLFAPPQLRINRPYLSAPKNLGVSPQPKNVFTVRAATASPPPEIQGRCPRLLPARGDEQPRRAGRQRQGTRALLEAPHGSEPSGPPPPTMQRFDSALWETLVSTTLGLEVPTLTALPRLHNSPLAKCGCKKFCMDFHGDHTSTCTAHSGATKAHDWMVSMIGPLFRTAGHVVRTQNGVTASAGQRRGDIEVRNYLRDLMTGLGRPATYSRTGACRTRRT